VIKEPLETVTVAGHRLGEYIREQRRGSQISLRQLSALAGVSNPYLSQIERGLRKPSAEILQQIAKALRISAEALYVQAGILEQREGSGAVSDAVLADEGLNERQKQVLIEIYESFRKESPVTAAAAAAPDPAPVAADPGGSRAAATKVPPTTVPAKTSAAAKASAARTTPRTTRKTASTSAVPGRNARARTSGATTEPQE